MRERAKLASRRFKVDSQSGHISDTSRRLCCNGYLFMSAQKDWKLVTIVIKSSIHSLGSGKGNAHCCNLSEIYTAGRKFCIHLHVFCGPLYSSSKRSACDSLNTVLHHNFRNCPRGF